METFTISAAGSDGLVEAAEAACAVLGRGEPVALPTETVYGLAADALVPGAAARIFEAKERPFFDPLICHLPDLGWLSRMTALPPDLAPLVMKLCAAFWPGPLTLVLPRSAIVPDLVTAGLETVAIRMSAHPVFQAIAAAWGKPLAAPSANRFGRISPTTAAHVAAELTGRIPLIVDGGPCTHGIESTIIAPSLEGIRILRSGPITREQLSAFGTILGGRLDAAISAPGQLKSHYAPAAPLTLYPPGQYPPAAAGESRALLAWKDTPPTGAFAVSEVLSGTGDLREAAATLFAKLRRLDESGTDVILAETVPEHGLGIAIMERLRKAAGLG